MESFRYSRCLTSPIRSTGHSLKKQSTRRHPALPKPFRMPSSQATQHGIHALGLTHGPIHAEMRHNDAGVFLLEIAARPIGGLCANALRFDGGVSLEALILRHALGEDISDLKREDRASGVMMIPIPASGIYNGVAGFEEAAAIPNIEALEITAKEGQRLLKLPKVRSYLGFIFARAETPEEASTGAA